MLKTATKPGRVPPPQPPGPACTTADHAHRPIRKPVVNEVSLDRAARIFRAVGDVSRLRILALLSQGEACVTEIAAATQEELSTISQRLRILRSEHLVVRRRQGKHINYALSDQHIVEMVFNALAHASETPASPTALLDPDEEP